MSFFQSIMKCNYSIFVSPLTTEDKNKHTYFEHFGYNKEKQNKFLDNF